MKRSTVARVSIAMLFALEAVCQTARSDPYPPFWGSSAVHFPPVAWPAEPADPKQCGANCGEWLPYTRFQNNVADPRTQDPSNGGTAPQNYVNIASSCVDKTAPSIYYSLRKGATASEDRSGSRGSTTAWPPRWIRRLDGARRAYSAKRAFPLLR